MDASWHILRCDGISLQCQVDSKSGQQAWENIAKGGLSLGVTHRAHS